MSNLSNYQQKSIRWLLKEKYSYPEIEVLRFLENADYENVQGWLLVKPNRNHNLNTEALLDVNRILQGEPVDYVIGYKYFNGSRIDLSLKPLIPRVETEYWVSQVLTELTEQQDTNNKLYVDVLDIFCGSGCIGISVLKAIGKSKVTFADVSGDCLEQTRINLELNKIKKTRYIIQKSDEFKSLSEKYDIVFANPPYVPNRYVEMSKDLYFEPKVALLGGRNGLDIIKTFLKELPNYVNSGGSCFMEFGDNQEGEILSILKKLKFSNFSIGLDQFGRSRYLILKF